VGGVVDHARMGTRAGGPPRDWREGRRLRALALHEQGWQGRAIAAALGVTAGAVSQWLKRSREAGPEALRSRPPPGPTPMLTEAQRTALPELLARGAEAHGFVGDVWTTKPIAAVIKRAFGVSYHPAHVSRLMRRIGWSVQKPRKRASQRDEEAVRIWREESWPALSAKRRRKVGW
jgi:transposase